MTIENFREQQLNDYLRSLDNEVPERECQYVPEEKIPVVKKPALQEYDEDDIPF